LKYPVLNDFIEKFHENVLYKKGETYPKEGFEADLERVKFLQSEKNKYKIPFLGPPVEEEKQVEGPADEKKSNKTRKNPPAKK
jgi:hypothetical protein